MMSGKARSSIGTPQRSPLPAIDAHQNIWVLRLVDLQHDSVPRTKPRLLSHRGCSSGKVQEESAKVTCPQQHAIGTAAALRRRTHAFTPHTQQPTWRAVQKKLGQTRERAQGRKTILTRRESRKEQELFSSGQGSQAARLLPGSLAAQQPTQERCW